MPRQFEFRQKPPKRANSRGELEGDLRDFANALQAHPGQWAQVPYDMIHPKWASLSDEGRRAELIRMHRAITRGAAWRRDDGVFEATRVRGMVWASWSPFPADGEKTV